MAGATKNTAKSNGRSRGSRSQRTPVPTPAPAPPASTGDTSPGPDDQAEPVDGVLVRVVRKEDGAVGTEVTPLGDVRVTELVTILELGLKGLRERLGLADG